MSAKKVFKLFFILLFLSGGTVFFLITSQPEVLFESIESKTQAGHPVFNRIKFKASGKLDEWIMKQSHNGATAPVKSWDEIKITVDKSVEPYQVSYQQFKNDKEIELKASCYACHSKGPRTIRPNFESKAVDYTFKDRLVVTWMNLKMKTYGKIKISDKSYLLNGKFRKVPLKYFGKAETQPLKVKTCLMCHNNDSFFSRGELQRQHFSTIKHLVAAKQMPPWPFTLSEKEKAEVQKFVKGF